MLVGFSYPSFCFAVSAIDISLLSALTLFGFGFGFSEIEGPEDTVYANGIFNVKIQIPERYLISF